MNVEWKALKSQLEGDLHLDETYRRLYATDASAYRELPLAVVLPKSKNDVQTLIHFARTHNTSLIPRTAGTSLAGQVVGSGIVVDMSKYFNQIIAVDPKENWVKVQPGVIRDDLNRYLRPFHQYFGPETSTANRAMLGGMVGNNACGANSVVYGSTRDHLLEVTGFLSDGSEATFGTLSAQTFDEKRQAHSLEGKLYQQIHALLSSKKTRQNIAQAFPKPSIKRRNTGYAIDLLALSQPFVPQGKPFSFCPLIAGSEGTLMLITEMKLNTLPLPPKDKALICIHCQDVHESLLVNLIALKYAPHACELIDHYIIECTKENIEQQQNRFFIQGDPGAILVVELAADSDTALDEQCASLIKALKNEQLGYHFPVLKGEDIQKIWQLRKAGLGLLANLPGDAKAQPVIEDTAVDVQDLPAYISDFNKILHRHSLNCVHYAHAGSGELHLRPILNLKEEEGRKMFRTIAEEISTLVKKYQGSLSGEHGDGRLRGEFIKAQIGQDHYLHLQAVKAAWDPKNILNPGKITASPPMDTCLRDEVGQVPKPIKTYFNWGKTQGVLRAAERCNGSGDCRKSAAAGGVMCPSYMATKNEKDTTRARANILREMLTHSRQDNPFDHEEIREVLDLCLSCKACKSECPSNVDMARLKAEFQQQYYDVHGIPFRTKMMGDYASVMKRASRMPKLYNLVFRHALLGKLAKAAIGIHPKRSMPLLPQQTMRVWFKQNKASLRSQTSTQKVYLLCDEFTNYLDADIGILTIRLLDRLGYQVILPQHEATGRALISKGLLKKARSVAVQNVQHLSGIVSKEAPLVGIEPSALLTLRDEYIDLVGHEQRPQAQRLSACALTLEEFLTREHRRGRIKKEQFSRKQKDIKVHGHCHHKALSSVQVLKDALSIPEHFKVHLIPSGCCGMAGAFGYEKRHYEVSMRIGELILFPEVRNTAPSTMITASGTSCRHQIRDGTDRTVQHPVETLWEALV